MSSAHIERIPQAGAEPAGKIRFVTAASLFDGHDASINIMRRILQASGVEVIHLGHNRSVAEIVDAAIQEDVQGIAVSSYQGGHVEYFKYMVDMLAERGAGHIQVFGGGGGVIVPEEIEELQRYGVARIYSPADGQNLGLKGMIEDMLSRVRFDPSVKQPPAIDAVTQGDRVQLARLITAIENDTLSSLAKAQLEKAVSQNTVKIPVLGITGTGGAGKSSLTDELIRRFRMDLDDKLKIAVLAVDPSRRKTGGALLGDRIRMNAIEHPNIFMRSLATRGTDTELPGYLSDVIDTTRLGGFDVIVIETPGIGQGDAAIVPLVDVSLYVMTPEYGAASQLEKIDMLDFAGVVAINKFDRKGAHDALRDVAKQMQRNQEAFTKSYDEMPVYGTIASRFNDDGVTALYQEIRRQFEEREFSLGEGKLPKLDIHHSTDETVIVPPKRQRYLAEIADGVRHYLRHAEEQARLARERQQLTESRRMIGDAQGDTAVFEPLIQKREDQLDERSLHLMEEWPAMQERYRADEYVMKVRGKELRLPLKHKTLSGTLVPRVSLPRYQDQGELLEWMLKENVPGRFPYAAGVFDLKREGEDPTRMFAGEGDPFRTNRRFKYLSAHSEAKRLSTAFDSVTLYGWDPDERPDIYGKVGNSGVSIATLEDMKVLYDGFDLCSPKTSVSMTINGPAPTILAMFLNTAIDQQIKKYEEENGHAPDSRERERIAAWALENVRGTVQADILKEDQGQNTCIFSTEFSLKMMGDIQQYFVENDVRNFYSVSISGYHIAEAGANPITQLAFTLANGFTYVEAYLARGMDIDDFAPNLSFFFS
ncbi:MAG: methylmalonyl-CoA mutase family protein, partial [Arenicellales bacterium]